MLRATYFTQTVGMQRMKGPQDSASSQLHWRCSRLCVLRLNFFLLRYIVHMYLIEACSNWNVRNVHRGIPVLYLPLLRGLVGKWFSNVLHGTVLP